jgi:uncharacterized membrane-anchored protein
VISIAKDFFTDNEKIIVYGILGLLYLSSVGGSIYLIYSQFGTENREEEDSE